MISHDLNDQHLSSIGRLLVSAAGLLLLLGCSDIANGPDQSATTSSEGSAVTDLTKLDRSELLDKVLKNAVQVSDSLYMVPKGIDDDGCEMFGPYSTTGPTATAIHYRQADGGFDIAKDPAVCKVDMVALGSDPEGCEMYRAKPVNNELAATDVTYYRDAEGNYVAHKTKPSCD